MEPGSSQVPPSSGGHNQSSTINLDRPVVTRLSDRVTS